MYDCSSLISCYVILLYSYDTLIKFFWSEVKPLNNFCCNKYDLSLLARTRQRSNIGCWNVCPPPPPSFLCMVTKTHKPAAVCINIINTNKTPDREKWYEFYYFYYNTLFETILENEKDKYFFCQSMESCDLWEIYLFLVWQWYRKGMISLQTRI